MECKTEYKKFHERCVSCKYFRLNAQVDGRWLEMCAATGEQLVWRYGGFIKSDRCPFKEMKNV